MAWAKAAKKAKENACMAASEENNVISNIQSKTYISLCVQ